MPPHGFGEAHAYFRGGDRGQLITVDADIVLLDEFDRMDPETLALAQQRIASSRLGWLRAASTPSAPETGINRLFLESDQRHYLLPCPGCGLEQALTLDNLDAERVLELWIGAGPVGRGPLGSHSSVERCSPRLPPASALLAEGEPRADRARSRVAFTGGGAAVPEPGDGGGLPP